MPLPYPDATLSHDWHLDPERIPVPAAPRSTRAHAEKVRRRRALLIPKQCYDPAYATDSPNWARWFAFKHEEARRRSICELDRRVSPPPPVNHEEDQEAEAAYQAAVAAVFWESEEDERHRVAANEEEEATYEAAMAQVIALSAAGDCVLPPVAPSTPVKAEPEPEPSPIERYSWTGVVRDWVSAPPVWMGATPAQEAAYLEQWHQRRLAGERRHGDYLEMVKSHAEDEQRQAAAAQAAPPDMNALWNTTFPWAGPALTRIELTDPEYDDDA